jgi:hypothetical protein
MKIKIDQYIKYSNIVNPFLLILSLLSDLLLLNYEKLLIVLVTTLFFISAMFFLSSHSIQIIHSLYILGIVLPDLPALPSRLHSCLS